MDSGMGEIKRVVADSQNLLMAADAPYAAGYAVVDYETLSRAFIDFVERHSVSELDLVVTHSPFGVVDGGALVHTTTTDICAELAKDITGQTDCDVRVLCPDLGSGNRQYAHLNCADAVKCRDDFVVLLVAAANGAEVLSFDNYGKAEDSLLTGARPMLVGDEEEMFYDVRVDTYADGRPVASESFEMSVHDVHSDLPEFAVYPAPPAVAYATEQFVA